MKYAILIKGIQNSGKTTTIRHFINYWADKELNIMKSGWQRICINKSLSALRLDAFCNPASPSETNVILKKRLERWDGWLPEILIIAEQVGGRHEENTNQYLSENNYDVAEYVIGNEEDGTTWKRFNSTNAESILETRSLQINKDLRDWLINNNILNS